MIEHISGAGGFTRGDEARGRSAIAYRSAPRDDFSVFRLFSRLRADARPMTRHHLRAALARGRRGRRRRWAARLSCFAAACD